MATTKVTQQDLKIFLSENNRDTEDGGGLRTGVHLTGEENQLFPPLGDQSNALGNLAMRLVYAAVDRTDAEPLLEGGFIIAEPPKNPAVSYLAFAAAYNGELRKNAVSRLEAYSVKTVESRMTLLGKQSRGSRLLMAYQMPNLAEAPLPKAGEVFCLDQNKTGYPLLEDYIKIKKIESEVRSFYNKSSRVNFKRRVIKIEITESLKTDYQGAIEVTEGATHPPCLIKETMVADSGKYYGVKKLASNLTAGQTVVKVGSIFENIVPSSRIATPLVNLNAGSEVSSLTKVGTKKVTIDLGVVKPKGGDIYYLSHAIAPGSFKMTVSNGSVHIDNGQGGAIQTGSLLPVIKIDYRRGVITTLDSNWGQYGRVITFNIAAQPRQIADTAAIAVDKTNQDLAYAITLDPPPLNGSVSVSYRSQGVWYDLKDIGTGKLAGVDVAHGTGNIDSSSNTVSVSLGALPDVGSDIIFSWATPVSYFDRSAVAVKPPAFNVELDHNTLTPNTVKITYLDDANVEKTATDNGSGTITGTNFTCKIDYAAGKGEINFTSLPKGGASFKFNYSYGNQLTKEFPSPNRNTDGTISLSLGKTNLKPRSVKMIWNVDIEKFDYISTTPAEMQLRQPIDPYITVFDDGSGNLKDAAGVSYGTVNYATGVITFKPDGSVKIPVARYSVVQIGVAEDGGAPVYRNKFSRWEYVPAGVSMPIGPSGKVNVWFNADSAINNHEKTMTLDGLGIDLTPLYKENINAGSICFTLGNEIYTDNNGKLYYKNNTFTGVAVEAGTVNYATGDCKITAWTPGQSSAVNLIALLTSLDKNPVDEVVFRIPQAPIQPRSLQLLAADLQGNNINIRADADGNLTGPQVIGKVDVSDGVVRCRFGQWVTAAGNESQIWYKAEAIVNGKIFKPAPVFADSIKYNAVAYALLPLNSEAIGVNTVRFPSDGRVPIYRAGDLIVIASRYKQSLGTSFAVGQIIQLNVTNLTSVCVIDAKGKHVTIDKYETNLAAGTIKILNNALTGFTLPLTAQYAVEETGTVSKVDISGSLTLVRELERSYDKSNTFVSSVMIGGTMEARATKPFTQTTWTNVWSNQRIGNAELTQLDTKNYPIQLTDDGAIIDRWVIIFDGGTRFSLYSETLGHILTQDWLQDLAPINPASNKPYFKINKAAFGPTDHPKWRAGVCVRFNTFGPVIMPWIVRATQPNNYKQVGSDGAVLCLRGNTVELQS